MKTTDKLLEEFGFKTWDSGYEEVGNISRNYDKRQKRIDNCKQWEGIPLCGCNDKVFVNIDSSSWGVDQDGSETSYEVSLTHENKEGQWCDIKTYSLRASDLDTEEKIEFQVKRTIALWELFYNYKG